MDNLSMQLLNRIGIVFDFFAGFLLAPELIGIQRLRKLEAWLEEITKPSQRLGSGDFREHFELFYGISIVLMVAVSVLAYFYLAPKIGTDLLSTGMCLLGIVPAVVIMMLVISGFYILELLRKMLHTYLTSGNRVQGLVTGLGIVLFVLGSLLQLLATF